MLRQIELNFIHFYDESEEFSIPLSLQGRGLQNLLFLFLCSKIQSYQTNLPKLFLIEEPEQNLEPQRQRSIIKIIKKLTNENSQIIIVTHSPFILALNKDLKGVKRVIKNSNGEVKFIDLEKISAGNKFFNDIRKSCDSDFELFESLFSNFIILWEGDCESSFYTTIMRNYKGDFPSEWLLGINCQGDNIIWISKWLKNAEYKVLAILDGDKPDLLNNLKNDGIYFIALKNGDNFENLIEDCLNKLNDIDLCEILIKMIGYNGVISYNNKIMNEWKIFKDTFKHFDDPTKDITLIKADTLNFLKIFKEKMGKYQEIKPNNIRNILKTKTLKKKHPTRF
ncbi:MAG: ATP-dependent nuclease [Promethearchaeia archaeon]